MVAGEAGLERIEPLPTGAVVGGYRIERPLARGADNIAYAADEIGTRQLVRLVEHVPAEGIDRARDGVTLLPQDGRHQARIAAAVGRIGRFSAAWEGLTHPAVVRVLDFVGANGTGYLVMAPYRGKRLATVAGAAGAFDPEEVDEILPALLDGLDRVHAAGLVHGDVCPASIVIADDGSVSLGRNRLDIDWLRARADAIAARIGDPYIAEEFFLPDMVLGPPADIYGLAATLFRLVTGEPPADIVRRIRETAQGSEDPILAPLAAAKGWDARFLAAITAGLSVVAEDRPQSVHAFRSGLGSSLAADARRHAPHLPAGTRLPPRLDEPTLKVRRAEDGAARQPPVKAGPSFADRGPAVDAAPKSLAVAQPVLPTAKPQRAPPEPALPPVEKAEVEKAEVEKAEVEKAEVEKAEVERGEAEETGTDAEPSALPAKSPAVPEPPGPTPPSPLAFTVVHPGTLRAGGWATVAVHLHERETEDAARTSPAGSPSDPLSGISGAPPEWLGEVPDSVAPRGTAITVVPIAAGCLVNPAMVTVRRYETVHRLEFRIAADEAGQTPPARTVPVRVAFFLGITLIGEAAFDLSASGTGTEERDPSVVRGLTWTRVHLCRAPDDPAFAGWEAQAPSGDLRANIEAAERFQLCWSPAAAASPDVVEALTIAVSLGRPDFIRVVSVAGSDAPLPAGVASAPVILLPVA